MRRPPMAQTPNINALRRSKAKVNLVEAGNSIFSEVNSFNHIDEERRSEARMRQLEHNMKHELKTIRASK